MKPKLTFFWLRRDLRLEDNTALFHALSDENPVQMIFIFDTDILERLGSRSDARVQFIHQEIADIKKQLREREADLMVKIGKPIEVWKELTNSFNIVKIYANRDYEPYARQRDKEIYQYMHSMGIPFIAKKDHVIFEKNEITKTDGKPYTVYTPYSKLWKKKVDSSTYRFFESETIFNYHRPQVEYHFPDLSEIGFKKSLISIPSKKLNRSLITNYHNTRNFPGIKGTTRLGIHLRFGTLSIRTLASNVTAINSKYLNELIWRDFYSSILWHFPRVADQNFNSRYDNINWRSDEDDFRKWCQGKTGYPIVDAGIRELNASGYMHNRVRMVVASFLTKYLLIHWSWGESYFADKLLDFDLASNNGGWQWAAGTGVDAAPYFRVFNPYLQAQKFDPDLVYIKKWIPEFGTSEYPVEMIDHKKARERALNIYKAGLVA